MSDRCTKPTGFGQREVITRMNYMQKKHLCHGDKYSVVKKKSLLVVPDDDVLLTRMCFLSEHELAIINKHRRPENRLGFAVLICYLRGRGFLPTKIRPLTAELFSGLQLI